MSVFQKPPSALKVMMDAYIKTETHKKWDGSEIENGFEFKVLTAVTKKSTIFWEVKVWSLVEVYWWSRGT
jgi:hypothetical protein